jgi:L-threonylcarbamoyladenylate synthase
MDDLYGKVELILDGGRCEIGVESSVVDMTSSVPVLLRAGGLPYEKIRRAIGNVVIHPSVIHPEYTFSHGSFVSSSPGMRYRHYSPKADVILIEGPREKVRRKIDELSREIKNLKGKKLCIISRSHNRKYAADIIEYVGSDFATSGRNLFDIFRNADSRNIDVIIAEGMEYTDLGLALMNRLKKAATRVINLSETFD